MKFQHDKPKEQGHKNITFNESYSRISKVRLRVEL